MFQVPALRIEQRGVAMFVTALPLEELRKHITVDYWCPDNEDGYQRPLIERRLAEVAKYVTEEQGVLPTSILMCIRHLDTDTPTYELKESLERFMDWGTLSIPESAALWVIDGQHRSFGVKRAYDRGNSADLADYPFPVTIMLDINQYSEMVNFNIINTRQRKMPTDIVDRHLVRMARREGNEKMIHMGKDKELVRAKITLLVDVLNEEPGPWYHEIAIPGVKGKDKGLVRHHAVVVSLEPVLKDPWLGLLEDKDLVQLLVRYWGALATVWSEAFEKPKEYRVQATVGLYSLHMVFPSVIQMCLSERDFSENKMRQIWQQTNIDADFWHKNQEIGNPLTLGTGMASIRALSYYLRETIPKATPVTI